MDMGIKCREEARGKSGQAKECSMNPREDIEAIFRAAVRGADPLPMIGGAVRLEHGPGGERIVVRADRGEEGFDLLPGGRVFVAGMGKAAARMALGLELSLGECISGGLVAVKEGHGEKLQRIRCLEAGHPVPDSRSVTAAEKFLNFGNTLGTVLTPRDFVIVLVSGGGSALLCAPADGLSLGDKMETTKLLLASGAAISEINCVRKHLSRVKGGRLAAALSPARVLALALSDVVGDDLDVIASGPTVPDPTSFRDACSIIAKYGLEGRLAGAVAGHLRRGMGGGVPETPKPGDAVFSNVKTLVVGNNMSALAAAESEAVRLGYNCLALSSRVTGEARDTALLYLGVGKDIHLSGIPVKRPACVLAGGETTVTLRGGGRGGRNQEMALAFLSALGHSPKDGGGLVFLSAGTDGTDGPTDAAGAVADLELYNRARGAGLDPDAALADNDSYTFFSEAGGLVRTGPTNTNVCDVQVLLVP